MKSRPSAYRSCRGFSLAEVIVTIAVVGILAAVASGSYQRVVERSRRTVAVNTVETLNQAVNRYIQLHGLDIRSIPGDPGSSVEEQDILRALQWDSPSDPDPGAPYMRPDYDPPLSAEESLYRAVWNGMYYELIEPGETGAGLEVRFDGGELGETVVFPDNFVPLSGY